MMFVRSSDSTMVSENIIENEEEKNISDTPADTIPESISIPTEQDISTQFINDNSTIISANNTPRVNNLPTSCNEKKCRTYQNFHQFHVTLPEYDIG